MKTKRYAFALERLEPGDWARFESFASQFLAFDHVALRTVAAQSGDLGRDSELFSPDGDPTVLLQYSVTKNWPAKIRQTAKRVRENFPSATILIYVSNQQIGAEADALKKELRQDYNLVLDVHDRGWFLDRAALSPDRLKIVEQLAADIVDPYLSGEGVIASKAPALNEFESKAAVLHLQLQWEDDSRDKGLTKLSFEALVKSALRGTSSENRVSKQFVRDAVARLLPALPREGIEIHVNSALDRLDRRAVRHWHKTEEVCLTHEEALRVRDGMAQKELMDRALNEEIHGALNDYFEAPLPPQDVVSLGVRVRRILDAFLLKKGEEFAAAVAHNHTVGTRDESLDVLVTNDFGTMADSTGIGEEAVMAVRSTLHEVLQRSRPAVQHYLRQISDGYTLFGFLRAVPDVQKVVQQIFRGGKIWLDTSVLLPILAETLLDEEEQIVSRLLRAALDAGMELRVTSGVIEEMERHVNRCITYFRMPASNWIGNVPFLYAMYALRGKQLDAFPTWVEQFSGKQRPKDDIVDYLFEDWGINVEDLGELVEAAPQELRWEVERIWREAHELRRSFSLLGYDDYVIDRLVKHDVECFLGVLGKRTLPVSGELGYVHWWLTFDKTVRDFEKKLRETIGPSAPKAPVMSPDFLSDYLAVGPLRGNVTKASEETLPVAMFDMLSEHVPAELLEIASEVRKECGDSNERLIRRKLRDALDEMKTRRGELAHGGFTAIREKMERALKSRAGNAVTR